MLTCFKMKITKKKHVTQYSYRDMLRIQTKNEMFEITRPEMMDELLFAFGMVMKKVSVYNLNNCAYIIY